MTARAGGTCWDSEPGAGIGDRVVSESSSKQFFNKIDENGNGVLEKGEIMEYVQVLENDEAGPQQHLEHDVARIIHSLDADADEHISGKDMRSFWNILGNLLNVAEVAEWVVHGIGIPPEIGESFLANSVSGRDFPELIANGGLLLETELGITDKALRKRIIIALKMRMLGIGEPPPTPLNVLAEAVGPSSVRVEWGTLNSSKSKFPIHKYCLQRRSRARRAEYQVKKSMHPQGDGSDVWITVMDGPSNLHTDTSLDPSTNYVYRVQAWNFIGHSDFVYVNVVTAAEPFDVHHYLQTVQWIGSLLCWIATCVNSILQVLAAVLTLLFGWIRLRRQTDAGANNPPSWVEVLLSRMQNYVFSWFLYSFQNHNPPIPIADPVPVTHGYSGPSGPTRRTAEPVVAVPATVEIQSCCVCSKKFKKLLVQKYKCGSCKRAFCKAHRPLKHTSSKLWKKIQLCEECSTS